MSLIDSIKAAAWFNATAKPYLIVDADLRIRALNAAYLKTAGQGADALLHQWLFDAFPNNPSDPHDGIVNLSLSLEHVHRHGVRHWMGVQRYDVQDPDGDGSFVRKYWVPVNTPLRDGGRVGAVLHHVEDVTDVVARHADSALHDISRAARALHSRFPTLRYNQVLAVLTQSHRVVADALGRADDARAEDLATMRLELLVAGHPDGRPGGGLAGQLATGRTPARRRRTP